MILIAVLYLIFPRDLIPDFLGRGPGLIDDLLLIALLTYFYRRYLREYLAQATRGQDQQERSHRAHETTDSGSAFDAYEVLGVSPSASKETIHAAYKARMQEYHPDKVAHLGKELQELAHRKAQDIQRAHEELCK
ncbi:MAG: DnaJ domain-containing protein [bacterium]